MRLFDAIFRFSLLAALAWAVVSVYAGCAAQEIVHEYPHLGLRIVQATPSAVHRACGPSARACTIKADGEPCVIFVAQASDLTHELRHCSGGNEVEALQDNW